MSGAILACGASSAQAVVLGPGGVPTPGDVNLKAWYRADMGVTTDGNGVTRWDDLSDVATGTARDLIPSVVDAARQPSFLASDPIFNGMPSVTFDGVQDVLMRATGNSPVSGNSDRTVFAVVSNQRRANTNGIEHVLHFGNNATDQAYGIVAMQGSLPTFGNHLWSGFDPGNAGSGWSPNIVTFNYDNDFYASAGRAGADRYWVNGISGGTIDIQATNTATTATAHQLKTGTQQFMVGSRVALSSNNPVEHLRGNIAEIIIFDTTLSDAERSQVESYLGQRYGVGIGPQPSMTGPFSINAGNFATAVKNLTFNGATARPTLDPVDNAPVMRLADSIGSQSGTMFLNRPVKFANDMSFNTQFEVRLTAGSGGDCCGDPLGADGMSFIIHADPRGPEAIGVGGGTMGYTGGTVGGQNKLMVEPSVVVELDTWHSGAYDPPSNTNLNGNHIGLNVSTARFSVAQSAAGSIPPLNDGNTRNVWVDYDGATKQMSVFIATDATKPGTPAFTQQINLPKLFSTRDLYVGFAGATGGAFNNHDIRSWDFNSAPSANAPTVVSPLEFEFNSFAGEESTFQFNGTGTAGVVDGRLRLTNNAGSQAGSAMLNVPVQLRNDFRFHSSFSFELSAPAGGGPAGPGVNGPGADGFTFVLTTGPNGPAVVGGAGGAIGLDGMSANYVAVEFDTWPGGSFDGGIPLGQVHIGVDSSGTTVVAPGSLGTAAVPRFNDGGVHYAWVDYYGNIKQMQVFLSSTNVKPELPSLTVNLDVGAILGYANEDVYMGFTAGTGGSVNIHEILSWKLAAVPEPSTYVLVSMGFVGFLAARRRMKK